MKTSLSYLAFLSLIFCLVFASCGPSKKLLVSQARVEKLQKDSTITSSKLNDCNEKVKNLSAQKTSLQNQNAIVQNENALVQNEYASVQNELEALAAESKMTIADQAKRLITLHDIIQKQTDLMTNLKNSIADALMNYKTDELYVYNQNGKVYVSLEEKLLFKSGSDVVDPKGKEALKSLAKVLNSTSDINVMIEGHTDNVPIKTKLFEDNWDLSTARATSILRILTNDYGFDPIRITASGRGQYYPVKTNDTVEGRAANRRTEIILSPDLDEIYTLLYQSE